MNAERLHATLAALVPIDGVSVGTPGDAATVEVNFKATATQAQRQAAAAALASFDWSPAADQAWADARAPERTAVRQAAAQAVADIDAYLAAADTGTAAAVQTRDHNQFKRLNNMMKAVIRRLIQLD
jgi:hypothetical protein